MSRNEQLVRQHKLLQLLERTRIGRTLDELKGLPGPRQVFRLAGAG